MHKKSLFDHDVCKDVESVAVAGRLWQDILLGRASTLRIHVVCYQEPFETGDLNKLALDSDNP